MRGLLKQTMRAYREDDIPIRSAALAYFSVFSLAPLLVIVIALLVLFGQGEARTTILDFVRETLGANAASTVGEMIESQGRGGGGAVATAVGILVLLFASTTLLTQLKQALNVIWKAESEASGAMAGLRNALRARLSALLTTLGLGLLLLLALLLTTVVGDVINRLGDALPGGAVVWMLANRLVALALLVSVFALIFRVLPDERVPWSAVWIGALVTAVLFVLASWLFGIYVAYVAVESAYGAAGSLVVLLLWVYLAAQMVLLGAEFTRVYAQRGASSEEPVPRRDVV